MRTLGKLLLSIFILLTLLSACGPLKDENDLERINNNNELRAAYGQVTGTYQGTVTPYGINSNTYPIEVKLYIIDVQDGVSSTGELQTRPELRGYYRRLDTRDDLLATSLGVAFNKNTYDLTMTASKQSTGSTRGDTYLSLTGKFSAGTIEGTSNYVQIGETGRLTLNRISQ